MTPDRGGGGEERRQSGSLSRLFRALTRRGSAEAVPKKLTFSPSKDDGGLEGDGPNLGSNLQRKLEEKFETELSDKQARPEASASSQSTEPEFVDSKEEQEEPDVDYDPANQGVKETNVPNMVEGQEHSAAQTASQGGTEVIPASGSPAESGMQSETSLQIVKPQKVTKGREVKSRFLNTLFTGKPKPRDSSEAPRRQPSLEPKREPSLRPQDKKLVQSSPKASKMARAANMVRSLSTSRQRPASRVSSEGAKEPVRPVVSRRKESEKGAKTGGQAVEKGRRSSGAEQTRVKAGVSNGMELGKEEPVAVARPSRKEGSSDGALDSKKEKGGKVPTQTEDSKGHSGATAPKNERLPTQTEVSKGLDGREMLALSGNGALDGSGGPEAAVLEAVRERLTLMQVGELAGEPSGAAGSDPTDEKASGAPGADPMVEEPSGASEANPTTEELRRERTESGRGASTREAVSDASEPRRAGSLTSQRTSGGENRPLEDGGIESPGVAKARKQAEWLAKLREQNGKKDGMNVGSNHRQTARKPSEWLMALREQNGQESIHMGGATGSTVEDAVREKKGQESSLHTEGSLRSIVSDGLGAQNGLESIHTERSRTSVGSEGQGLEKGLENGHVEAEGHGGGRSTPGKKVRGVVVPSRVWLDNSKKKETAADGGSLNDQRGKQPGNKRTSNGAPVKQRAAFGSLKEAGHWLPSSPRKILKPLRSAVGSAASTPTESRATTPSRQETVSAPASPNRTALASRRSSGKGPGSAPASPKKAANSGQPRASSRTKIRPLGGQQNGQEEGGARIGTSPSKGLKKPSGLDAARHVRVMHNRWLQWCFVNARAQEALAAQQKKAETSLFSAWQATAALRSSVAAQKVQLHRETHGEALDELLARQTPPLERWSATEQEHRSALGETMAALEAAMLRVPLTGGASADPQRLRSALADVKQVVSTAEPTVQEVLPKAVKADALLSQLAETAAQERALVKECQDLLAKAATLEIEERSLRAHLIQLGRERELGRTVPVMATPMRQGYPLTRP